MGQLEQSELEYDIIVLEFGTDNNTVDLMRDESGRVIHFDSYDSADVWLSHTASGGCWYKMINVLGE